MTSEHLESLFTELGALPLSFQGPVMSTTSCLGQKTKGAGRKERGASAILDHASIESFFLHMI